MAKGYWVANNIIDDPEAYKAYQSFVGPYLTARGAKFLTRGGMHDNVEGPLFPRTIIIEFPSYAEALAAYNTPEYQKMKSLRSPLTRGTLAIVEGLDEV